MKLRHFSVGNRTSLTNGRLKSPFWVFTITTQTILSEPGYVSNIRPKFQSVDAWFEASTTIMKSPI